MDGVFDALLREILPVAALPVDSGFTQPNISAPDLELREAGFVDVELWSCAHTAVFRQAEDLYAFEATRNSAFRTRVQELPIGDVARFTELPRRGGAAPRPSWSARYNHGRTDSGRQQARMKTAATSSAAPGRPEVLKAQVTLGSAHENPVDHRLFGQFLERASFGEPGPEGAHNPATGTLRADVTDIARTMRIPMIRFPGGTDIDYTDWRDLVDGAAMPGPRAPTLTGHTGKSLGTRFGIDEYFALRDDLGNQTILVVNFLDAVAMRLPIAEAARRAAGLVAYANAPLGAARQDEMPD